MTRLLIAVASLLLGACSTVGVSPFSTKPTPYMDSYAVATLEPVGSCGWQVARDVTANATDRRRSARLTDAGKVSAEDLRRVMALHDLSRSALERACSAGQDKAPSEAALKVSRDARAQALAIMERK